MSTSIPSTCNQRGEQKVVRQVCTDLQNAQPFQDVLMFLLYSGHASGLLCVLIEESSKNIGTEHCTDGVMKALESFKVEMNKTSLTHMRIIFFLLLSKDTIMRKKLCEAKISWFLPTLCPFKACCFYETLSSSVIPKWIRDENVGVVEFEDMLRESYLSS